MKYPDFGLQDRSAIITGGAQGLGQGIALALAHAGASVVVADLPSSEARGLDTVAQIEALGARGCFIPLDVTDVASIQNMTAAALATLGHIDILINNAGVNAPRLAVDVTEAEWDRVLDVDLKGSFFCAQAAGRHMIERGYGRIINISSQMGLVGYWYRSAYCSAKAGLANLTRVLAIEWAKHGVTVNAVAPTFLHTPFTERMFEDQAFHEDVLRRIPMGRIGEVEDVVGAVIFLASDAAALITGHTLSVDGGWTAW